MILAGLAMAQANTFASECRATSGPRTAVLVELYTSEGCSSCPPADRWLSTLAAGNGDSAVIPVGFHVQYWDYIGWKDAFGDPRFTERQRAGAQARGNRYVYTPQVVVDGGDFRNWPNPRGFAQAVESIQRRPARAILAIDSRIAPDGSVFGTATATLAAGIRPDRLSLVVLPLQGGLSSVVTRGENRGERLAHEHVARDMSVHPLARQQSQVSFEFPARPGWRTPDMSVVAFVQDSDTGQVLQALACR